MSIYGNNNLIHNLNSIAQMREKGIAGDTLACMFASHGMPGLSPQALNQITPSFLATLSTRPIGHATVECHIEAHEQVGRFVKSLSEVEPIEEEDEEETDLIEDDLS